jgi:FlaA1/EpsC-like NDP-sugar epimerase
MLKYLHIIITTIRASTLVRRTLILAWHGVGLCFTYWLAFQLRFDGHVPYQYQDVFFHTLPVLLVVSLLVFSLFRLHSGMWSYFSVNDLARMTLAIAVAIACSFAIALAVREDGSPQIPRSVVVEEFLFMCAWMLGARFVVRWARERIEHGGAYLDEIAERVLVVGKLKEADLVIRGMRGTASRVVGIVADDYAAGATHVYSVELFKQSDDLGSLVRKLSANSVLILPPFNGPEYLNKMVASCMAAGVHCSFRMITSLVAILAGKINKSTIRSVDIDDLIGRDPVLLDRTEVRRFVKNKKVMVTGAGGSIGSELCRQLAAYEPSALLLFESSEFALYQIDMELRKAYPSMKIVPHAGDIRHAEEVEWAIDSAGGIDIIYHSAAYKHVPLMELNVCACFRTNVLGTHRLAQVAVARKVDRFVMISSDKAVRPSSIMGATKRLAERVISEVPQSETTFVSVRFGNVLESSGSVVPLFKQQIAAGGPVTVTSENVRRFFMTTAEAVDLVLLAGTIGRNGDIMVLDMGEPIKIIDLARRLITLSGLVPGKDIRIVTTGLRPGEKEYEEVMAEDENVVHTPYEKISLFKKELGDACKATCLARIEGMVTNNDEKGLRALAAECIPENTFRSTAQGADGGI